MDTVIREIETENGKRLVKITGEDIEDEELERIDEHAKEYLEHVDQVRGDNIIRAVPMESTVGSLEDLVRKRLEEADIVGKPNSPELHGHVLKIVGDLLKREFPSHKFQIGIGSNPDGQHKVMIEFDRAFVEKRRELRERKEVKDLKEKKERRKNQTTMEEDFINFLIG